MDGNLAMNSHFENMSEKDGEQQEKPKDKTATKWLVDFFKKAQSNHEKMSWDEVIKIIELASLEEMKYIINAFNEGADVGLENGGAYYYKGRFM